ncbi:hypothetical protein MYX84_12415 [Acidobacteria bacterium AH-259-O06]|nr:hypothetical protein [Acidobacteria bacterium AH-259-O06]
MAKKKCEDYYSKWPNVFLAKRFLQGTFAFLDTVSTEPLCDPRFQDLLRRMGLEP